MKTAVVNFKVDPQVKAAAQKRANKLGLPLSVYLSQKLQDFALGRPVSLEFPAEQVTPKLAKLIKEAEASGTSPAFGDADTKAMKRWLAKPIDND